MCVCVHDIVCVWHGDTVCVVCVCMFVCIWVCVHVSVCEVVCDIRGK